MTEKIIINGHELCDRYDDCTHGCPIWNENFNGCCPIANSGNYDVEISVVKKETEKPEEEENGNKKYDQATEPDEFRYIDPSWLIALSEGLTTGARKYPNESWKKINAKEHCWRAIRHLVKFINGDNTDTHLINASMRVMMSYWTAARGIIDDKDNV